MHLTNHFFFFQAEDGIRDLVRSRGLGDVYKRQLSIGAFDGSAALVIVRHFHESEATATVGGAIHDLSLIHI